MLLVAMVNSIKHNTCFSFHIGVLLSTGPGTYRGDGSDDDGEYLIYTAVKLTRQYVTFTEGITALCISDTT